MSIDRNGIVFSVYQSGRTWKVVHCMNTRRPSNPGRAVVKTFTTKAQALSYVEEA